jgi:branched-chain amino acid transport system permease protein
MTLPLGVTFDAFTDFGFWTSVGILAGTYVLFTLGLQLNVGYTGIVNFGQAGFMAIGAYAMGVLVVKAHWSFWLALPTAVCIAIGFGLLVGLPSLRLRADYFAIATIAAAEIVRITALNLRDVTGGNQGLFGFDESWNNLSEQIESWLVSLGWSDPEQLFPLFIVVWAIALIATVLLHFATKSPWGRVLRAVREDEDAARALGKNTLAYKLQSLAIAATLGALASYWGVAGGAILMWTILEGTRFIDLPISAEREAAVRFMIVGLILILLMAFRPQGMFGKKEEMVLGD